MPKSEVEALQAIVPRAKGIKRGFRAMRDPKICGVSFESLPVWLWALRPKEWSEIFITESDERRIHQAHPELRTLMGERFVTVEDPPRHDPRCAMADVWWISGTEAFLKGLTLPESIVRVIWGSGIGRRIPRSMESESTKWQNISHAHVGGVTNARGWIGITGLDPMTIPQDLQRSLAHVIKHSIRGIPCSIDFDI